MHKQSWSLKKFKDEFGLPETERVTGYTTRQGVYAAMGRNVRVVLTDDDRLETWESKRINSVKLLS